MLKHQECLKLIQDLESLVRSGDFDQARRILSRVGPRRVPREFIATFANLARRVNLIALTLKMLNPIVRPKTRLTRSATEVEIAEYGVGLQKIGAIREAYQVLAGVNETKHPPVLLYRSFCLFSSWDYASAIPLLERFCASQSITEYQLLVGELNLAAALVIGHREERAGVLLDRLRKQATEQDLRLIRGNTLELSAQLEINRGQFDKAEGYLRQAEKLLVNLNSPDALYVQKWKVVVASLKAGKPRKELSQVRKKAVEFGHWETIRHCDFFRAKSTQDRDLWEYLYYGTPYPAYRLKIEAEFPSHWQVGEQFIWTGSIKPKPVEWMDLVTGENSSGDTIISTGQLLHRLLLEFCRDFYKPLSLGGIHSALFPHEFYNPYSSPDRVYQLVKRMRQWLASESIPVRLRAEDGHYSFNWHGHFGFVLQKAPIPVDGEEFDLIQLKNKLGAGAFSASEARKAMAMPYTSMNRLLKWGLTKGHIQKLNSGPKTKYKFSAA